MVERALRRGLLVQSDAAVRSTMAQYQVGKVTFPSVLEVLRGLVADGATIVLTTHLMDDVERLADHDDELMEQLLSDMEPPRDRVFADLSRELAEGQVTPVFFGSAYNNFGVRELLEPDHPLAPLTACAFGDTLELRRVVVGMYRGETAGGFRQGYETLDSELVEHRGNLVRAHQALACTRIDT